VGKTLVGVSGLFWGRAVHRAIARGNDRLLLGHGITLRLITSHGYRLSSLTDNDKHTQPAPPGVLTMTSCKCNQGLGERRKGLVESCVGGWLQGEPRNSDSAIPKVPLTPHF
jgi:hypothetical protein